MKLDEFLRQHYYCPSDFDKQRFAIIKMGIDDEDFWKAKKSGISDTQLYKQAGNGIVVDVFTSLLDPMIEKLVE